MFREASMFAAHLRQVEKDLSTWEKDIEGVHGVCSICMVLANTNMQATKDSQHQQLACTKYGHVLCT